MSFSKEIWGSSVWNLFHTIAHKIREDKFLFHKSNIIYIIENICNTLPCPDCSKDASAMLKKVDFAQINNKADFKLLMFNFHNAINTKLKKPLFDFNELDSLSPVDIEFMIFCCISATFKIFSIPSTDIETNDINKFVSNHFNNDLRITVVNLLKLI